MEATAKQVGPIDFVGDDNGNPSDRQIGAFRYLIGNLRPGATYAIQDIESSYSPETKGELSDGTMAFFRRLAGEFAPDRGLKVGSITFARNNIVATKAGSWHQAGIRAYGHTHPSKAIKEDL